MYVYDGNRLLAEYDQHGGGIQPLAEYFTGNGNIIARKMYGYHDRKLKGYQPNTRGFLFFYHHDVNRNVMDITDRSGNSLFKYRYDAFGEVYAGVMEPYNHHGLTEKFYDTKVKLYHFKARDYDPVTGQWIQRDRYRGRLSDPRTLHGYMYAYQNPVRFEDPLGYDIDVSVTDPIEPVVGIPEDPEAGIRDMLDDLGEQINESGKIYGFGSQGEEVKEIQTILNEGFGKDVKVDGIYGQETKMAVEEVQAELGVTVDGIVGQETLEAMKKAVEEVDSMLNPELQIKRINKDIEPTTTTNMVGKYPKELDKIPDIGFKFEQVMDSRTYEYYYVYGTIKVEQEINLTVNITSKPNANYQISNNGKITIKNGDEEVTLDTIKNDLSIKKGNVRTTFGINKLTMTTQIMAKTDLLNIKIESGIVNKFEVDKEGYISVYESKTTIFDPNKVINVSNTTTIKINKGAAALGAAVAITAYAVGNDIVTGGIGVADDVKAAILVYELLQAGF
ncbi:hypothetical protein BBF96_12310 [Anoxybacter fermentans]|uniref:Peptidoglycan binding-like domain-containing protein n=1 Tax=Anoxybacter fermentans TaxID=1323375 RepID=A0A3S9T110_9FIRM|nr:peptidoglycan-binding protein [Anoxybacter fermentans]AZR74112.1 hypothetical protein BBF96_12310 [Anoxybacter fermentans]